MLNVKIIAVGNIKEKYYRDACDEYIKRLGAFCRTEICELREARLPENPSPGEIDAALADEGSRICAAVPPRYYTVALAVEGKRFDSEALAALLEAEQNRAPGVCFIIGSSHGLSPAVKQAADLRLSLSELTFPHRLFRVMLLETIYRSFSIIKGTKYHK